MLGDMLRLDNSSEDIFIYLNKLIKRQDGVYVFNKYDFFFDDDFNIIESKLIGSVTIKEVASRSTNGAILDYLDEHYTEHLI